MIDVTKNKRINFDCKLALLIPCVLTFSIFSTFPDMVRYRNRRFRTGLFQIIETRSKEFDHLCRLKAKLKRYSRYKTIVSKSFIKYNQGLLRPPCLKTYFVTVHTPAEYLAGGTGDFDDERQHPSKHFCLWKDRSVHLSDPGYGDH